jgi:hypothetical protein
MPFCERFFLIHTITYSERKKRNNDGILSAEIKTETEEFVPLMIFKTESLLMGLPVLVILTMII